MLCPFCREEIADGAIKCKHCSSMLVQVPSQRSGGMEVWQAFMVSGALVILAVVGAMIDPMVPLILVIISSIWAACDAASIKAKEYSGGTSAGMVLLGCLLFWAIVLPWYIYLRSNILAGNRPRFAFSAVTRNEDLPDIVNRDI